MTAISIPLRVMTVAVAMLAAMVAPVDASTAVDSESKSETAPACSAVGTGVRSTGARNRNDWLSVLRDGKGGARPRPGSTTFDRAN